MAHATGEILHVRAIVCVALLLVGCGREPLPPHRHAPIERIDLAWEGGAPLRVWKPTRIADSTLLPLLLFSPGLGQVATAYDSLLTSVAANGFVVVGVPLARNLSRALDRALGDSLAAIIDTGRIGAFGHSHGGSISAELCHGDPRIKAALNLDGAAYPRSVTQGSACPVLLFVSRRQKDRNDELMFERSRRMWWVSVAGLDHMAFTDAAFSATRWRRFNQSVGLELDAARVHDAAARYASAFFAYTLNDGLQPEELQRSPYPFVSLRSRP